MKQFLFTLWLGIASVTASAQGLPQDSTDTAQNATSQDGDEAGGITAEDATATKDTAADIPWLWLLAGIAGGALVTAVLLKMGSAGKKTETAPATVPEPESAAAGPEEKAPKISAAEVKKMRQDIKLLTQQLDTLKADNLQLEKNLGVYRNFDSSYFGEAFRKLAAPMNEALENGSRKDIMENLMKIMIHFTSLTRYKISKKQPYDEANIHYLLNQKGNSDSVAIEINGATPVDKIPKNIKVITDLLKEQGSQGLDDAIIAGYKIKNLS